MPNQNPPPNTPEVNLDVEPFVFSSDPMKDFYALQLVKLTFNAYENFRQMNHDPRWTSHESLYLGFMPQRVWEGTNVPRASLPMQIVFDQIESAIPSIVSALFGIGDEWFDTEALPGTSTDEARQIKDYLMYVTGNIAEDYTGRTAQNEIVDAIKDILLYGNGGLALEWDARLNTPIISRVDLRDLYIDPGASSAFIDSSRSVIRRKLVTVEEINSYRDVDKMSVPAEDVLHYMAKNRPITQADVSKQIQEALRRINLDPQTKDSSPLPSDDKLELLIYTSPSRIIWTLNRQWILYNERNPYSFIPYIFAPCYTVPGRFYAQSIAEVQEAIQRYMEALLNGHLDEVSLNLHPPRAQKRGVVTTPSQQRWRPGVVYAQDPKDVGLLLPSGITVNVFNELAFFQQLSERRTGVNVMNQAGRAAPGNANRTLGGMQMQAQGTATRLATLVKNVEDYLVVPMFYKLLKMAYVHNAPFGRVTTMNQGQPQFVQAETLGRKIKIKVLGSSKMMTRSELAKIFPYIFQFIVQGPFMQQLMQTGKTIDFDELFKMMIDATGTGQKYNLVRQITPQEQEAMNRPSPEAMMEQQKAQQDAQVRLQMGQMKAQTEQQGFQVELQKEAMKQQPNPMDLMKEQVRLAVEKELNRIRIEAEREKNRTNAQIKQQELQMKQQESAIKLREILASSQLKQSSDAQASQQKMMHQALMNRIMQEHARNMPKKTEK